MRHFSQRCDSFRVDCKLEDTEALLSAARYGARGAAQVNVCAGKEIWEGNIDDRFLYELISKPLDSSDRVKWYALFLKKEGKTILSASRYGTQFDAFGIDQEDVDALKNALDSRDFDLFVWEEAPSGSEIDFMTIFEKDGGLLELLGQAPQQSRENGEN